MGGYYSFGSECKRDDVGGSGAELLTGSCGGSVDNLWTDLILSLSMEEALVEPLIVVLVVLVMSMEVESVVIPWCTVERLISDYCAVDQVYSTTYTTQYALECVYVEVEQVFVVKVVLQAVLFDSFV